MEFSSESYMEMDRKLEKKSEVEDISLRFRTMEMTGLIFLSKSQEATDSLEIGLFGGQVQISLRIGHHQKEILVGQSLNDDIWHSLSFKRRGNVLEANIDDEEAKKGKTLVVFYHSSNLHPGRVNYLTIVDIWPRNDCSVQ